MEFLERLQGAYRVAREKSWTLKFVTLSWAEDIDLKRVRLDLQHLVRWIRREYGFCEYAKVPELTKRGRIHLHLAMVIPYIRQTELSQAWRRYSGAPVVDIRAVTDIVRLRNELAKYLSKAPAGKVTYSRQFPKAEKIMINIGPCDSCDGQEHRFKFLSDAMASSDHPGERGRMCPGEPVYRVSCDCWIDLGTR